jgi:hypothetical protein
MKKTISCLLASTAILFSCNNKNNTQTISILPQDTNQTKPAVSLTGEYCYSYIKDKDSVMLRIVVADSNVTGKLSYNFNEKDNNDGVINGKLKSDTLLADYIFMSEGKKSVRQVAFLLTDSSAKEGYGEQQEQNGKMIFVRPHRLSFNNSFILLKASCD